MPILSHQGKQPRLAPDVFVAEGAWIIGDVTIGAGSSVWFNTVIRGDVAPIVIGEGVNIQDNCTLHGTDTAETRLGNQVSLGHGAIVHGATLDDEVLVGMNAVVLTGARVGAKSVIGASAVVPEGKVIPPRSLVLGIPGKVVRELTDEPSLARRIADRYRQHVADYRADG